MKQPGPQLHLVNGNQGDEWPQCLRGLLQPLRMGQVLQAKAVGAVARQDLLGQGGTRLTMKFQHVVFEFHGLFRVGGSWPGSAHLRALMRIEPYKPPQRQHIDQADDDERGREVPRLQVYAIAAMPKGGCCQ